MAVFDMTVHEDVLEKTVQRARQRNIIIPTFAQQKDPSLVPDKVKAKLKGVGLWDINPINLFRITWHNDVKTGLFGDVNYIEIPSSITGIKARVVGIVGKYFPTGAHKVGAAFGCLVPRLVTGQFDPTRQAAVWPSTGNYCRGGAFDCSLLATDAVAILPEGMSKERFDWLREIGTKEVIGTPGTESNVKEIYDKVHELKAERGDDIVVFNQFDEFGNALWHYHMTGSAFEQVFNSIKGPKSRMAGYVSATGSAGTIAAGEYLKKVYPYSHLTAVEALQCPTLYANGFGAHRIEGIGDKHVPWIHNVRNTDAVAAIDDEYPMHLLRLFNEEAGKTYLEKKGVPRAIVEQLNLLGISSLANLVASIRMAKYEEMDENDIVFTVFTDSADLYLSRIEELRAEYGPYTEMDAALDYAKYLEGILTDWYRELNYRDRKQLHNLKYFTWVEQQGRTSEELRELWEPEFWDQIWSAVPAFDKLIDQFNERTGLLAQL
ncbi:MAG: pyridoxal-phosphate dependent enzyme [Candidatus Cryosericum sp.]